MHVAQGYVKERTEGKCERLNPAFLIKSSEAVATLTRSSLGHLQSCDAQRPQVALEARDRQHSSAEVLSFFFNVNLHFALISESAGDSEKFWCVSNKKKKKEKKWADDDKETRKKYQVKE